jgi:hypothetical protein
MKKILLLPLLFTATSVFANVLHSYDDIHAAVLDGKSIRIALDFDKCTPHFRAPKQRPSFGIGIFTPNEIVIEGDGRIDASLLHFTLHDPHAPSKPIYQFARYTITSDNNVNLSAKALDAVTYTPISEGFSFDCKIDSGAKIYD